MLSIQQITQLGRHAIKQSETTPALGGKTVVFSMTVRTWEMATPESMGKLVNSAIQELVSKSESSNGHPVLQLGLSVVITYGAKNVNVRLGLTDSGRDEETEIGSLLQPEPEPETPSTSVQEPTDLESILKDVEDEYDGQEGNEYDGDEA